jgi:hypothetical protein
MILLEGSIGYKKDRNCARNATAAIKPGNAIRCWMQKCMNEKE